MSQNLVEGGKGRRTWHKASKRYYDPEGIYQIIHRNAWPYKTRVDYYRLRDLALASLLYLTSGRINEVLRLVKHQFREDEEDPDFLVCHNFWVSKRKAGVEHPTPDIPLPRVGRLAPFTEIVEAYLAFIDDEERLFKFSRARAFQITRHITSDPENQQPGKWNHWFRAQSLSYQVNLLRSTILVASDRGVKNPQTLAHYYTGQWKEHKEEMKK